MLAYGFLNLINLYEKLTVELYDWISSGHEDASSGMALTSSIQSSLCNPLSLDGVSETQQVDILITQQWLQATMWRLNVNHCLPKLTGSQGMLPFHLPILVGRSVMEVLTSVSQSSIDSQGIGMVGWNDRTIFMLICANEPPLRRSKSFSTSVCALEMWPALYILPMPRVLRRRRLIPKSCCGES
jgi:hypothetical protein